MKIFDTAATAALTLGVLCAPAFAQAPGQDSAVYDMSCDRDCLLGFVDAYMAALGAGDRFAAPLADDIMFTENNVVLTPGDGLWRTIDSVSDKAMRAADPQTGNAAWFGVVTEQGNPAFYTMRVKVEDRAITQVETIVVRRPDPPKPFGDPDADHAPEWDEVLPEDQRLPRERLRAIADGYFETVELNDGQIFTAFTNDCGRLENGISTTSGSVGAAATISGCEQQFKAGIYRINKRVRERRYPLIDETRGIVVATGFFDHANWFDEYELNNGNTMKTVLVWPNSISLIEAFRIKRSDPYADGEMNIRKGEIQRIEATFTYVPYSMHNPFNGPETEIRDLPPAPAGAPCDDACLTGLAELYMDAMVAQDPSGVPWADEVKFSENGVKWMIGDSIWGTASAHSENPTIVTDPQRGTVVWTGIVEEHGQPSYYSMSMAVRDGRIAAVDSIVARQQNPGAWAPTDAYSPDPFFTTDLPQGSRTPAARMEEIAQAYIAAISGGAAPATSSDCRRVTNGLIEETCSETREGDVEQVRSFNCCVTAIDEARGVVTVMTMADLPLGGAEPRLADGTTEAQAIPYPYTRGRTDLIKIVDGEIVRVDGVETFLPYKMPAP